MRVLPYDPSRAGEWLRLLNLTRTVPIDLEDLARRDTRWPDADLRLRFLGVESGGTLAIGQISVAPYAPPDHLAVLLVTDPAQRGSGIGSAMLATLEEEAVARGFAALTATIPEASPDVLRWAERRGFLRHATRFDSLLDLTGDHPGSTDPAPDPIAGITWQDMTGATEDEWRGILSLFRTLLADAPDMQGLPPWSEARCRAVLRDNPAAREHWIIVARAGGRPVGMAIGHALGEEIYSFFTGVAPDWRGKGLGKAMKLRLIAAARKHGARIMRTTNLDRNMPALRLNAALGFRRAPGSVELRKRLPG
jgi:GNAT superfamily N-acetyltransferase